ncbi:MAG: hypothetical protein QOJ19_994 [Acidimicrobiia bacterium]|nr:hypothetical protein [Acidimicrobiia bacterium]
MRWVKLMLTPVAALGLAASAISVGGMLLSSVGEQTAARVDSPSDTRREAASAFAKLPVSFIENRGQTDDRVKYYALGGRYSFYMTPTEVMLDFARPPAANTTGSGEQPTREELALALKFLGGNPNVEPKGTDRAPGVINDLRGSDPSQWRTDIPQYRDVVYSDLWPGIDLRLREQSGVLKYEFHVAPGASPSDIQLAYSGAESLSVSGDGGLQISTGLGTLQDSAPLSYQDISGVRVPVTSRYIVGAGANQTARFSFGVGAFQPDHELVIDPGVQYTTFLGGNAADTGEGIAVNSAGNAFVTGTTQSPDYPTTAGTFRRTGAAQNFADVFVTKLNPAGSALVYSTFVGGSDMEFGHGLAIDSAGNAYVTGTTKSSNFPTTAGAFDRTLNIPPNCPRCATDNTDGFVFKLNAAGSGLTYSTYLGGTDIDSPRGIAVDGSGSAFVTGETLSGDLPTTAGAFRRTLSGEYDMFVTKLNPAGSALTYSTFLGGTLSDDGQRISVDSGGNAYAMGFSRSSDFPTTAGAFDTTFSGGFDVTLTKLNSAGSALVYSTYLGGTEFDTGGGLTVDSAGSAFVAGTTPSADFPTTPGAYDTVLSSSEAFVTKFNAAGSALVYSTFVGGSAGDSFSSVVLDTAGNAWLTGNTGSSDYPVTPGAPDTTYNGGATDATIAEMNANGSALLFATFLGGSQSEGAGGYDIARDPSGNVYVTGLTYSQDFPATTGAFDTVWNGDLTIFWGDAFVVKLDINASSSTPPAPPAVPAAPTLLAPSNASSQPQPISFDWSDTASTVSYSIQIDDSSAFSAPLVRDQSVTSSFFAATGLATTTHFWRVRAVNSAGVASPWSAVRSFTPQPAPPPAQLSTIDLNPSTVVGGNTSAGTVVMDVAATDGAVISLSSSNSTVASVPATTTVAPNGFTGTFAITTSAVAASTTVTITATYNGATRSAPLTVTPTAAEVSLQSVTISPSSVAGGSNTSGFVTLSGGAPAAGATVSLASSNPAVASVPADVTVGAGSTAWGFTVTTASVSSTTPVTITATYNGVSRTAAVTVTAAAPPPPPPPPPQNVTVTVSATGRSGETVVSTPAGISVRVGSTGSASFASGTSITLRVSSGRDVIWSGACSSGGSKTKTCTFTANANSTVGANVQ